jgi:ligand-binding SRPBCC domain-containing protein
VHAANDLLPGVKNGKIVGKMSNIAASIVKQNEHNKMAVYKIQFEQDIPATLETVWDFISSPMNLREITPDSMNFTVTSNPLPEKMYPGMMITYKVSPVLGIPLSWCTEITQVNHLSYFVDEQREGPYQIWHHEHFIREIEGGVRMTDIIHYKVPFGILGKLANFLFVKAQLRNIFSYRFQKVEALFGKMPGK